ncbi:hypothetical protein C8Q74DRAFT_1219642 [Fomes fomentarius]|nr:hypothetical protein C8Q74DRAFT_1219642 [Fomes fomentarius]
MPKVISRFAPPVTVTPGEYLVCVHEHYQKTNLNERWHNESARTEYVERYHTPYSRPYYSPSPSPSPPPIPLASFMAPHANLLNTLPSRVPRADESASHARKRTPVPPKAKRFKRLVTAERKLALKAAIIDKSAKARMSVVPDESDVVDGAGAKAARAITCLWKGCKERIADGRDLWRHIELAHDPLGIAGEEGTTTSDKENEEREETEAYMDVDARHIAAHGEGDTDEEEDEEMDELDDDDYDPRAAHRHRRTRGDAAVPPGSLSAFGRCGSSTKFQHYTDRYQTKIRCEWRRCTTTIQFAGLRRHIESKHSGLRNTGCPKGCGYWTNRPDMMPRHALKCHYRGPKREATEEE